MKKKLYAIIDIETTGMYANREKITEIAVILHDGEKIIETYETLLNPERSISYQITSITGINDSMVAGSPKFYEVAKHIVEMTEGAVFVAHNVDFDYSFVQEEFRRLGFTFVRRKLCTVKLSRKTFPGLKSYALGNLIKHFGIKVTDRHRAMADAAATAIIFKKIIDAHDAQDGDLSFVQQGFMDTRLPKGFTFEQLDNLPETTGVYYFRNKNNEIIYVGKSINIKKRITDHFADRTKKGLDLQNAVTSIDYEETGSELIALLLEDREIKRLKPKINKSQRATYFPFAVYAFKDEKNYLRFHAVKTTSEVRRKNVVLREFTKIHEAKGYLRAVTQQFNLCENLMDIAERDKACFNHQIGSCKGACVQKESADDYNLRAMEAAQRMSILFEKDFFIIENGKTNDEKIVVLVRDGNYFGYGIINVQDAQSQEELLEAVKKYPSTAETNKIIRHYLSSGKQVRVVEMK